MFGYLFIVLREIKTEFIFFTSRGAPSLIVFRCFYHYALSVFGPYLISGMNSLNERSGTISLSTTVLLLPAVGSAPAALAAKGAAPTLKSPGSCGY